MTLTAPAAAAARPYGAYVRFEVQAAVIGYALGQWEDRDETRPQPEVRRAANTAMDAIDALLRELHITRARLVAEIRRADDATAARVDAMLAAGNGARP